MSRVDFFTCVQNGSPFIRHHIKVFEQLRIPWAWHITEGVSSNIFRREPIHGNLHNGFGMSIDGTSEYLQTLKKHPNVFLYDIPNEWESSYLTERFQKMLSFINEPTIAWELDVDEYWTVSQIETMVRMFEEQPHKTAAWFLCRYFVGPRLMLIGKNCAGNNCSYEWKRCWRHLPGMCYAKHDPPVVTNEYGDIFVQNPFLHDETARAGLMFNHYSYVTEAQVKFKETRYGFRGALDQWKVMNDDVGWKGPLPLTMWIDWLGHGTVERAPEEFWFKED